VLPPFLTDECVPDSVGNFLESRGHALFRARDLVLPGTADKIIAVVGNEKGAIVVTNDNHFKGIASRISRDEVSLARLRRMHRVFLMCPEPMMVRRFETLMTAIEFEFARFQERSDTRMYLTIGKDFWRSQR
jgi:Domain of unknown function (DUF5615)